MHIAPVSPFQCTQKKSVPVLVDAICAADSIPVFTMDVVLRCPPGRKYGITFSEPGDANLGQGTRVLVTGGVAEGDQRLCTGTQPDVLHLTQA